MHVGITMCSSTPRVEQELFSQLKLLIISVPYVSSVMSLYNHVYLSIPTYIHVYVYVYIYVNLSVCLSVQVCLRTIAGGGFLALASQSITTDVCGNRLYVWVCVLCVRRMRSSAPW